MKPVLVIDVDTLTVLPSFWGEVVALARKYDQRVICITQRTQDESNVDEIDEWFADNMPGFFTVFFTNGMSKVEYIEDILQIESYILCDGNPRRRLRNRICRPAKHVIGGAKPSNRKTVAEYAYGIPDRRTSPTARLISAVTSR